MWQSLLSSGRCGLRDRRRGRRRDAAEVRRVVAAAGPFPARDLWIETERPRAIDLAAGAVRRDQLVRRHALLDPLLERRQMIELVRSGAAAAVAHARRHEEAIEL